MMGVAAVLQFLFYKPPSFQQLHGGKRTVMEEFKRIDFVGAFLLTAGLALFLLGVSWGKKLNLCIQLKANRSLGGSPLPWTSARILCLLIIGGVVLIVFVFWGKQDLSMAKYHLTLNRNLFQDTQSFDSNVLFQRSSRLYLPGHHLCHFRRFLCWSKYHLAFTYVF